MKPRIRISIPILTCAAAILLTTRSAAQAPLSKPTSARAAIESILTMQQEAWNRGDVDAFLQGYWRSPELTFSGSTGIFRGWDRVKQRYKQNYPDRAAMGHLTFSGLEFHQLGPRAYLVLGNWHLDRASGDIGGVFTLVFQRFPEGWLIIHDHTSLVPAKP
ncbi:MAG TPA: nuclear transport factor 2 family protein [Candidatus Acidoferrum sp.]|nr:nuclear transport factor 2 family protein [Candidatus Acidoferrum sp.]